MKTIMKQLITIKIIPVLALVLLVVLVSSFVKGTAQDLEPGSVYLADDAVINSIAEKLHATISLYSIEADIAAINELWNQYGIATTSGDLELYVSLWDDSGISMGPDAPPTIGIEQIRASMEGFFSVLNLEGIPIVVEEVEIAGDWAFTRVAFRISVTPKGEPEASPRSGKALSILKRQADGSWKLYIDCWRFDAPPPAE